MFLSFTASYRGGLGFFVETINGQSGDWAKDGSWWHTYSQEPGTHAHCEGSGHFRRFRGGRVYSVADGLVVVLLVDGKRCFEDE